MKIPFNIGLKLFSTDNSLIRDAKFLQAKNLFDYIELYTIPGSYSNTINTWKGFDTHFIIHAPHSGHGTNFAQADKWETNQRNFNEARRFADTLGAGIIIVHGGSNGTCDEMLRQIKLLDEERIALENKPMVGINDEACIGWSPDEFRQTIDSGVLKQTVLDFGHAIYAANSFSSDAMNFINEFMALDPNLFHLSDGDSSAVIDSHYNLGNGNFDLDWMLSLIPNGAFVTIETPRHISNSLEDFATDVNFLTNIILKNNKG